MAYQEGINRDDLVTMVRQRLDDKRTDASQVFSPAIIETELNQSYRRLAIAWDIQARPRGPMSAKSNIDIILTQREYTLPPDFRKFRQMYRTDLSTGDVGCEKIDADNFEEYSRTDGMTWEMGYIFALDRDPEGRPSIILPRLPRIVGVVQVRYQRQPRIMDNPKDVPIDLPAEYHPMIAVDAALRLAGPDSARQDIVASLGAELSEFQAIWTQDVQLEYEEMEVEDVT